jgi:D-cysteine desulfhydrase
LGFVSCAFEIRDQVEKGLMPEPKFIWVAGGSGGTVAGLALGVKLCGLKSKIKAVRVVEPHRLNEDSIALLANKAADLLNHLDSSIPKIHLKAKDINLLKGYLGPGYGHVTPEAQEAIDLMENLEGIHLEPTYTAKTVAAMLRNIPYKPKAVALFINTYNSRNLWDNIPPDLDLSPLPPPLRKIAAEKD